MTGNFKTCLALLLIHEGGFVDHPKDPGGATNKGVTLKTYREFCGQAKTVEDLKNISDADLEHIYHAGYWAPCQCEKLPPGVDYVVFDSAVNSGQKRAIKWLQKVCGVTQDGLVGADTIQRSLEIPREKQIDLICNNRLAFLHLLPVWDTFGKGWSARIENVRNKAKQLE